jgi:hypothetical protein
MSKKGFGKKEKTNKFKQEINDIDSFKQTVIESGNRICSKWVKQSEEIRLKSEKAYGGLLIEARLIMVVALAYLVNYKEGIPGKTNEQLGEILRLIAIFWQSQFDTERLISEGQYVKASAVIKQDLEIRTRIIEIKKGVAKVGTKPNVKHVPMLGQHYGDLNNIAHISKPFILDPLTIIDKSNFSGVGLEPIFHEGFAKHFYELYLFIFYEITVEAIELFQELYPDDFDFVLPACNLVKMANDLIAKSKA